MSCRARLLQYHLSGDMRYLTCVLCKDSLVAVDPVKILFEVLGTGSIGEIRARNMHVIFKARTPRAVGTAQAILLTASCRSPLAGHFNLLVCGFHRVFLGLVAELLKWRTLSKRN
mmetsp:Transcript_91777/g.295015  ORF Transcript_91777/g.295015 Transcript_91777/m.295015 type:complete len:115 (+) Transcript_91777:310-654(+)